MSILSILSASTSYIITQNKSSMQASSLDNASDELDNTIVRFICPECLVKYRFRKSELIGNQLKCDHCGTKLIQSPR